MATLDDIANKVRKRFDDLDLAREKVIAMSRKIVRESADTIRAIHRGEIEAARQRLSATNAKVREMHSHASTHPVIANAGFVTDAEKEHAEANVTLAYILGEALPDPDDLGVSEASYLNGMAEAIGELRRHIVDCIRLGRLEQSERILEAMNDIYYALVTFDYPDAISQGLRRRTDAVRSLIEATRADLTRALRQKHLEAAMQRLEGRLGADDTPAD